MAPQTTKDYIALIRGFIRDNNGGAATPDPTQYVFQDSELTAYLQMAVDIYTTHRKRRLPYTLTLMPGQEKYTLPIDWITADMDTFDEAIKPQEVNLYKFAGYVLPTLNGSPPLYQLGYDFFDAEQFLNVSPTPQIQADINFDYYAGHSVTSTSSTIPFQDKTFVAALAGAKALLALSVEKGQKMQKYKIGQGLQIDDSQIAVRLEEQAGKLHGIFEANVVLRPYGEAG